MGTTIIISNMNFFRIAITLLGFLVCLSVAHSAPENLMYRDNMYADMQYQNTFDRPLTVNCNEGDGMYKVSSVLSNHHKDRSWNWECREVAEPGHLTTCNTTDYVNNFDEPMFFMCGANRRSVQ